MLHEFPEHIEGVSTYYYLEVRTSEQFLQSPPSSRTCSKKRSEARQMTLRGPAAGGPSRGERESGRTREKPVSSAMTAPSRRIGKISAECCSFSAVSAPIFARKYAWFSIFQNLPDYQAEFFEIWQHFANFATFAKFLLNFHENC